MQKRQSGNAGRKRWRLGKEKRWNKFSDPLFADKETNREWVKRKHTKDMPLPDEEALDLDEDNDYIES